MIAVFNGLVAAAHIVDSGIRHTLRDSRTLLVHQANLFTKRIGILLDLGKLLSRDILQLSETGNAVWAAAVFHPLETDLHDGRPCGAASGDKRRIHKIVEGSQAGRRQGEKDRKILPAA